MESPAPMTELTAEEARYRQIADTLATPDECARLVEFSEQALTIGDGYGGEASPHTKTEAFYGYTFSGRTEGDVPAEHLLALQLIQRTRKAVISVA